MFLSAVHLSRAISKKEVSCKEIMQLTLNRIDSLNPGFNAIVAAADSGQLLRQAEEADRALAKGEYWGWMHGMPHAVKDLANLKDFVTSRGSPLFAGDVADNDDIFVEKIRNEGAIFIGKTNVPEFGLGSQTYNRVYGSTGNAFDSSLAAGGSGGGAAVALATGMLPVADGSDMMGSLRNPAAYNNVIGFRPGLGRIPKTRDDLFFDQLSTEGPMGRTVEDVIQLFSTMSGSDARTPFSVHTRKKDPGQYEKGEIADYRVGWLADYVGYLPMEPGVKALCESVLQHLAVSGAVVDQAQIEFDMPTLWQTWLTLRQWLVSSGSGLLYENPDARAELKPEIIWEIEQGRNLTADKVAAAGVARSSWYLAVLRAFEDWDILALPSAQVFPFPVTEHWPKMVAGREMDTYHRWMEVVIGGSLCGCPVISLPAGFDDKGRSMGIQFMAPLGQDEKLLEFALAYEEVNPWHEAYSQFD